MRVTFRMSLLVLALVGVVVLQTAQAQGGAPKGKPAPVSAAAGKLNDAADALGMLRGPNRLDAINTMEYWGSGTSYKDGQPMKTDYHGSVGYDPAGMRVELTRTPASGGAAEHIFLVVNDKYAWNETALGGGLAGSKGTATAMPAAFSERSLQLWTLPYGAIKAGIAAGDKAKVSMVNGATVITFPLSGPLAGITETITLNAKDMVSKVEAHSDKPMAGMVTETDYSDYADRGDITSDFQFPGHIVEKAGDKTVLDITIKMDDPNNPFLIFPTPDAVGK